MRIEQGKYYKTRDGRKAGPMTISDGGRIAVADIPNYICVFSDTGLANHNGPEWSGDLISEWNEGPVRDYGRVKVNDPSLDKPDAGRVNVSMFGLINADELRAASAILNELASALDNKGAGE